MRPLSSTSRARARRGVALVLVLCALFVLTMVVLGLASRVNQTMEAAGRDDRLLQARALSFSGLQIALHPQASAKTPALRRQVDASHGFRARIVGEGGKLQLNWVLVGENPTKIALLKSYLETKGLDFQQRNAFVDCLLDWVSPGSTQHLNGSRTAIDGTPVPGKPFQDLSEIKRVVGNEALTRQSDWEDGFTLLSKGPIDLQWADADLLGALPGVGSSRAQAFVKQRRGPDKIDGTADDLVLQSAQEAAPLLGLSPELFTNIQALVTVGDPTVRIVSVGSAQDALHTIEVVARKEGMQPEFLQWKEY